MKRNGYKRRDFRGGVYRREMDAETGEEKSVQVPASYWTQDEDDIPLDMLTEFWEHNNTQFTQEWRQSFNDRLCRDYIWISFFYDPETSPDSGATHGGLVEQKESFFDSVRKIEKWPFQDYTVQKTPRSGSLVSDAFFEHCPEYAEYLAYKSTRFRSEDKRAGHSYADWRAERLRMDSQPGLPQSAGYEYRDEILQLGDIEADIHAGPSAYERTSIYEYLAGKNLVPLPGAPELSVIRGEAEAPSAEQAGKAAFVPEAAVPEAAELLPEQEGARGASDGWLPDAQAESDAPSGNPPEQDNDKKAKTRRQLAMDDLNRRVADLDLSPSSADWGVGYGR